MSESTATIENEQDMVIASLILLARPCPNGITKRKQLKNRPETEAMWETAGRARTRSGLGDVWVTGASWAA